MPIPFNVPTATGSELATVAAAVTLGHLSADGPASQRCARWIGDRLQSPDALMTSSCSAALELAAIALGIGPGDEVIVPSFAFPTTAAAFALRGARVVFADTDAATLGLDPSSVERAVSPATRAIVTVHYGGNPGHLAEIARIAERAGVVLVEDAAHGLHEQASPDGVGTTGGLVALSFHETKNVQCGEGGALVVRDERLLATARIARMKGTNRDSFIRGEVPRYEWVGDGSNFALGELLAAYLWPQLEVHDEILHARRVVWQRYREELSGWAGPVGAVLPASPDVQRNTGHVFPIVMPDTASRDGLLEHLRSQAIQAVFHYQPLHSSPMGRQHSPDADCPVAESIARRLLRLPLYTSLSGAAQADVIAGVLGFRS